MVQGNESIFIKVMSCFIIMPTPFEIFFGILYMTFPCQFVVYYDSEKFGLWHFLNYLIFNT